MIFTKTSLAGAYTIDIEKREDDRGFFARIWCEEELSEYGLETNLKQANMSLSLKKGTLRGMHYQVAPHQETKLVRCTKGAVYDVIIDLRPESETYKKWFGVELSENNHRMLYVPKGLAHGFVTLEDTSEVSYLVTESYHKDSERGLRYNDPAFNITWPTVITAISDKDNAHADFKEEA